MIDATCGHFFVTRDGEKIFNMIEDESGDIFWGYGHISQSELIEEVNRWLIHVALVTHPDDLISLNEPVEHLWARMDDEYGERFTLVNVPWLGTKEAADNLFPVTRLML